jgi:hypothetical protein
MKLAEDERSEVRSVSCNETQASETKCAETCWSNYPRSEEIVTLAESECREDRSARGTISPT